MNYRAEMIELGLDVTPWPECLTDLWCAWCGVRKHVYRCAYCENCHPVVVEAMHLRCDLPGTAREEPMGPNPFKSVPTTRRLPRRARLVTGSAESMFVRWTEPRRPE